VVNRRRLGSLVLLIAGVCLALYLSKVDPQEQHIRIVLGAKAPEVTMVALQYVAQDGEIARDARFSYRAGSAPRVIAHEPQLASGDYRIQIEVETPGGRRTIQRQATLGGGSTQIDVSNALDAKPDP
jgi:hypothetical protein